MTGWPDGGAWIPTRLRQWQQSFDDARHWRRPSALTVIAPLRPEAVRAVSDKLSAMGRAVEDVPRFPVTALSTTTRTIGGAYLTLLSRSALAYLAGVQ